jgi:hypothetical protein
MLTEIEQFSRKLVNFGGFELTFMRSEPTEVSRRAGHRSGGSEILGAEIFQPAGHRCGIG